MLVVNTDANTVIHPWLHQNLNYSDSCKILVLVSIDLCLRIKGNLGDDLLLLCQQHWFLFDQSIWTVLMCWSSYQSNIYNLGAEGHLHKVSNNLDRFLKLTVIWIFLHFFLSRVNVKIVSKTTWTSSYQIFEAPFCRFFRIVLPDLGKFAFWQNYLLIRTLKLLLFNTDTLICHSFHDWFYLKRLVIWIMVRVVLNKVQELS